MLKLDYDKEHDVLYIKVSDNSNSYGAEEENNINVFRDVETDQITGYMVFDFMSRFTTDETDSYFDSRITSPAAV